MGACRLSSSSSSMPSGLGIHECVLGTRWAIAGTLARRELVMPHGLLVDPSDGEPLLLTRFVIDGMDHGVEAIGKGSGSGAGKLGFVL
jgi:hypothetical protein